MTVELSHWYEGLPCRFNQTFEQSFALPDWRVEKRYQLAGEAYQLLSAMVRDVNVIDKARYEPATIDWTDYCAEILAWLKGMQTEGFDW